MFIGSSHSPVVCLEKYGPGGQVELIDNVIS
jgi:hypothetical protein